MPTTVSSNIQASGGDYATIALWEDGTDNTSLVAADEIRVGKLANEGFTEAVTIGGATVDATRYRVLTTQASASFVDNIGSGALYYNTANGAYITMASGVTITLTENYVRLEKLQVQLTGGFGASTIEFASRTGTRISQCIARSACSNNPHAVISGNSSTNALITNCLVIYDVAGNGGGRGISGGYGSTNEVFNCTFVQPSNRTSAGIGMNLSNSWTAKNCASFGFSDPFNGACTGSYLSAVTGSTYDFGSTGNVDAAYSVATFTQPSTASAPDYRLPSGSALINVGTSGGNIPTTDILGTTRSSYDIGCFEFVATAAAGIANALGNAFHPGKTVNNVGRFFKTMQGHTPAVLTAVFRRTLSAIGTKTGSRQTHQ